MEEVLPGIFHWSARHPKTGGIAHSHLLAESGTVLDPMVSDDALELLRERTPHRVVLTNRHHYRESARLVDEFEIPVLCPESGLHEFAGDGRAVEPYAYGERIAPTVIAHELGAICPDDAAIEVRASVGVLAFADGLIRSDGELGFVPDFLLGDDAEGVKAALAASLGRLVDLDFDAMLFAHGEPLASGARDQLRAFLAELD